MTDLRTEAIATSAVCELKRDVVLVVNFEPVGYLCSPLSALVEVFIEPLLRRPVDIDGRKATLVAFDARPYLQLLGERWALPSFERGRSWVISIDGDEVDVLPLASTSPVRLVLEGET